MRTTHRMFIAACVTFATFALAGCKQQVTAKSAMPDNGSLDHRAEMVKWHQEHDKQQNASTAPSSQ